MDNRHWKCNLCFRANDCKCFDDAGVLLMNVEVESFFSSVYNSPAFFCFDCVDDILTSFFQLNLFE